MCTSHLIRENLPVLNFPTQVPASNNGSRERQTQVTVRFEAMQPQLFFPPVVKSCSLPLSASFTNTLLSTGGQETNIHFEPSKSSYTVSPFLMPINTSRLSWIYLTTPLLVSSLAKQDREIVKKIYLPHLIEPVRLQDVSICLSKVRLTTLFS